MIYMTWSHINIIRDDGTPVEAVAPVIISASRSTDIPGFYSDWFFHRLKQGYSAWINPFNGIKSFVSYSKTRFIVFWSKNPQPLIVHLPELKIMNIGCYIQYTLNDYEAEGLEKGIPGLSNRIETFKNIVDILGVGSVVWRFDPLILTDRINEDALLAKIENIGDQLQGYTEKLVFSFADIVSYKKVKTNMQRSGINYREWTTDEMVHFAGELAVLNKKWGYSLATCGEKVDLSQYGILHNHCVDEDLIIRISPDDDQLMDFLGVTVKYPEMDIFGNNDARDSVLMLPDGRCAFKTKNNKDKGQRLFCGCMVSKDIGEYNSCAHMCEYCYANTSKELACSNLATHKKNPFAETITGR